MTGTSNPHAPIRVVAVTQDDPFFTGTFFATFLDAAKGSRVRLVEIVLLKNFNESRLALARRLLRFYGPRDMARLVARYARANAEERRGLPHGVKAVAASQGVATRALASINDSAYLRSLAEREVDVLLSVAAPEMFRREALCSTPLVLNVHVGRLPDYRGMMPTFWALLHGDAEVVITVHEMAERVDAGRIVAEWPVPVGPDQPAFSVSQHAKAVAGRKVVELLATTRSPEWPAARPVDPGSGRYFSFPRRDDAQRLRASGRALL